MPARASTKRGYDAWIDNHILPRWGDCTLSEVQARPVLELLGRHLKMFPDKVEVSDASQVVTRLQAARMRTAADHKANQ